MLPGRDGFALLDVVRRASNAGVVMLTARDGVPDRLRGLRGRRRRLRGQAVRAGRARGPGRGGAAAARAHAVGRRRSVTCSSTPTPGSVLCAGATVDVTATELRLLCYLAAQRGRVVSKAQILTRVWGYEDYDPNLVEVHVSALRRKLGRRPRLLHTVRGLGYVLRADERRAQRVPAAAGHALSMAVLAVLLVVVGVLTDVVFTAQSRADLRNLLVLRADVAKSLGDQGYSEQEVVDQVRSNGIRPRSSLPTAHVQRERHRCRAPGAAGPPATRCCASRCPTAPSSPSSRAPRSDAGAATAAPDAAAARHRARWPSPRSVYAAHHPARARARWTR